MPKLDYVFMVLEEHPYGREMLLQLMNSSFEPKAIIEEASPIANEEREKFLVRIKGYRVAPTFTELVKGKEIARYKIPHHNKKECRLLLEKLNPRLVVLGGTRIIRKKILSIPPDGMLNSHPGLLPEVRGSASVAWAIYYDIPMGSTSHFIDPNIDTGDIVIRREIPVHKGDTYKLLCWKTLVLAGTLMTETVQMWKEKKITRIPQGKSNFPTFKVAPPEVLEVVYEKLARGTYKHMIH
jgi:methionyl-tRNA formyltransferase